MKRTLLKSQFIAFLFLFIGNVTFAQWQKVNDIDSFPRARPTSFVIGDTAYLGNGDNGFFQYTNDFRGYTQNSNTWVEEPACPGGGGDWGFRFVINDTGYVGDGANPSYLNTFYAYSPSKGWFNKGTPPGGARAFCTGFSIGNKGYYGTGSAYGAPQNDFYEYDPTVGTNGTWTQKANLPVTRYGCASFSTNGKGYIGLGGNGTGETFRDMYRYTPAKDKWDTMASMPSDTGMEEPAYFVVCGKLIVTCGDSEQSGQRTTKQTWMFDPSRGAKGTWTRLQDFPGPLPAYAPAGWTMGDTGFIYGGYDYIDNNYFRQDMYRYVPSPDMLSLPITLNLVDTSICSGASVSLSVSGGISYLWSTTDTSSSITVSPTTTTTYTVTSINGACYSTDTISINVSQLISVGVTPDSPSVCNGQKITLTATGGGTYQWVGTSDTTDTITVNPSQDTTYELLVSNGTCSRDTFINVKENNAPPLIVQPQSTSLCLGQSLILTVPVTGSNYTWSPASALHSTTGDSVLATPTVTTTYMVNGTDSLGCSVSATDIISVTAGPSKPVITQNGNVLTSSATQGNQWQLNDIAINGATNQTYTVTIAGWYTVTAENPANGCSTTSDSIFIIPSGINQLTVNSDQLSIYPNPTTGEIYVNINLSVAEVKDWNLKITDVLGRIVYTRSSLNYSNEIDLSNLSSGVYFITVINKTVLTVVPVVKQN